MDRNAHIDAIIRRITSALSAGVNLHDIHDTIVGDGVTEEDFFFCYVVAKRITNL